MSAEIANLDGAIADMHDYAAVARGGRWLPGYVEDIDAKNKKILIRSMRRLSTNNSFQWLTEDESSWDNLDQVLHILGEPRYQGRHWFFHF